MDVHSRDVLWDAELLDAVEDVVRCRRVHLCVVRARDGLARCRLRSRRLVADELAKRNEQTQHAVVVARSTRTDVEALARARAAAADASLRRRARTAARERERTRWDARARERLRRDWRH